MFIVATSLQYTANSSKYINHTYTDENGNTYIISQEPNPNYPGDEKVKMARMFYLFIPQGQADEIANSIDNIGRSNIEVLYIIPCLRTRASSQKF